MGWLKDQKHKLFTFDTIRSYMKPRNVVSMLRVSTPGQATDKRMGLQRQQNDIDTFCKVYGLNVVEAFQIVMSGADVQRGREFKRMLSMLKRHDIVGVVVCTLDRLLRAGKLS